MFTDKMRQLAVRYTHMAQVSVHNMFRHTNGISRISCAILDNSMMLRGPRELRSCGLGITVF